MRTASTWMGSIGGALLLAATAGCGRGEAAAAGPGAAPSPRTPDDSMAAEPERGADGAAREPASNAAGAAPRNEVPTVEELQQMAPARGYLEARKGLERPLAILGGPLEVTIRQQQGGVFVALPDTRELDPDVFGRPGLPRSYGGSPVVTGLPPQMRETADGAYTRTGRKTPFGDAHMVLPNGTLELSLVDATATDAATSKDRVKMVARWQDREGNTYEVVCCKKLATHGVEFPTFGGVVTNHMMHGFTGVGSPLMPTLYSYAAFWGMGEVKKNGEVVAAPRMVHGMLTEYVRGENYELVMDEGVTPTRLHFHLMVPPVMPTQDGEHFQDSPVSTGFTLPGGKELPFWHVMFESTDVDATRAQGGETPAGRNQ